MGRIHYETNIGPNSSLVYLLGGTEFQRRLKKKIVDLKTQLEKDVKGGTEDQRKLKVNKVLEQVLEKVPVFDFCNEIMLEVLEVAKFPLWLQRHKDKLKDMLQVAPTKVIAKAYMPEILHMFEEPSYPKPTYDPKPSGSLRVPSGTTRSRRAASLSQASPS